MAEINAWMQGGTMKKFVFLTVILSLAIVIPLP